MKPANSLLNIPTLAKHHRPRILVTLDSLTLGPFFSCKPRQTKPLQAKATCCPSPQSQYIPGTIVLPSRPLYHHLRFAPHHLSQPMSKRHATPARSSLRPSGPSISSTKHVLRGQTPSSGDEKRPKSRGGGAFCKMSAKRLKTSPGRGGTLKAK